eukprot:8634562-Pyramimonas_sp.AAC.1
MLPPGLAPAVNRQPGHRRAPRRAPFTRKSARSRRRELLEGFLEKGKIFFSRRHEDGSSNTSVLIVKLRLLSSY